MTQNRMTLNEYIESLTRLIKDTPLLAYAFVYYASDEEGNSYNPCWANGTILYTHKDNINNRELENDAYNDFEEFLSENSCSFTDPGDEDENDRLQDEWDKYYIPVVVVNN